MKLQVYFDKAFAGELERTRDGSRELYLFTYAPEYLASESPRPISVTLPLDAAPYRSDTLFPFFQNLLAEGWLLDLQAATHKIDKDDKFALIQACGLECMGAVSLRGGDE